MKYELKSIFKNKVTWIFIFILIILCLKTVLFLEVNNFNNENAKDLAYQAAMQEATIGLEKRGFYSQKHSANETKWFENMLAFDNWKVDTYRYISKCYKKNKKSVEKEEFIFNLQTYICVFNLNADPEKGHKAASVVFDKMLDQNESILKLKELPFNYEELVGNPYASEDDKAALYKSSKYSIEYNCTLLKNYGGPININPLWFLSNQLSFDQLPTVLIGVLIILFATSVMVESKKNRSIQLVELVPGKRVHIFTHYYLSIWISSIVIIGIGFGIPLLILGLRHGIHGWNLPILVDPNGFLGLKPYVHTSDWGITGIGKAYGGRKIEGYDSIPPSTLVFWPVWKFMITAFIVSFLKIVFLNLVGCGIGLLAKRYRTALLISVCFAGIYGISQYVPANLKWNPFSIQSGWDTALGGTHVTWLNAVILLVVSIVIVSIAIIRWNNKRDY
ncbi:hypothetical protein [Anaeromicropila herbilytica]|uniref:Uncharacterized protein n=1 Tax=Anaeromicropila herbilytica TaxID=2785025 RepID=A0A7R7IBJ5_9FIRM|nr:hypothetical protein [Anaeromicropila herbilytica]BCN28836.1 hypothetical protein bsdtb5_01310 [Anaeromicropila herbilytica]